VTSPFESKPLDVHQGDVDLSWDALHHTVGKGPTQAAPGNHKHKYEELLEIPVSEVITSVAGKSGFTNNSRNTDTSLTADVQNGIIFETSVAIPAGMVAIPFATVSGHTEFTIPNTGYYGIEWYADFTHGTVGQENLIQMSLWIDGAQGFMTIPVKKLISGWNTRAIPYLYKGKILAGSKIYVTIRPVGSTTGWQVTWTNINIISF